MGHLTAVKRQNNVGVEKLILQCVYCTHVRPIRKFEFSSYVLSSDLQLTDFAFWYRTLSPDVIVREEKTRALQELRRIASKTTNWQF